MLWCSLFGVAQKCGRVKIETNKIFKSPAWVSFWSSLEKKACHVCHHRSSDYGIVSCQRIISFLKSLSPLLFAASGYMMLILFVSSNPLKQESDLFTDAKSHGLDSVLRDLYFSPLICHITQLRCNQRPIYKSHVPTNLCIYLVKTHKR